MKDNVFFMCIYIQTKILYMRGCCKVLRPIHFSKSVFPLSNIERLILVNGFDQEISELSCLYMCAYIYITSKSHVHDK